MSHDNTNGLRIVPVQSEPAEVGDNLIRVAFDCAPVGMAVLEAGDGRLGRVLVANKEFCNLLRAEHDAVIGVRLEQLFDGIGAAATSTLEPLLLDAVEHHHFEECLRRDDGSLAFLSIDATRVECGDPRALAVVSVRDATDVHDLAARFAFVADHDLLTSLLNRRGFETRLVESLARSVRYGEMGGVVLLDLDHFKAVNDSDGHTAGDTLLQAVAEVLRTRLRSTDLVARVGGDEFALMLGRVNEASAVGTVESLLQELGARISTLAGAASRVTVSAGIALFDGDHPTTVAQVLEAADTALSDAKRSGRAHASLAARTA